MEPWQRAQAGLFLAMQYPTEVPGVSLDRRARGVVRGRGSVDRPRSPALLRGRGRRASASTSASSTRPLNVDLSGGEKKRNETLQLGVLRPKIAVLDELDSGLDVDALRACARRVEQATEETGLGVLAITHYSRLLHELRADVIHILVRGEIRDTGGPELAEQLEESGYAAWTDPRTPNPPTAPSPIRSPTPSVRARSPSSGTSGATLGLRDLTRVRMLRSAFCTPDSAHERR